MTPDITLKDYYLNFIHNASLDIIDYNDKLTSLIELKTNIYNYIVDEFNFYKEIYDINLSDYELEYINKEYNSKEILYNKVLKLNNIEEDANNKIKLIQLIKYCVILRKINEYTKLIVLSNDRKNLPFKIYKQLVTNYYLKVHKNVLDGHGYKFNYGIGIFCINRWIIDPTKTSKKRKLNFAETNKCKKALLEQGKKIYNENEAIWYKNRGIPYDGIDYRVYMNTSYFYELVIINSTILSKRAIEFKHIEYVSAKYRGLSFIDMADICNNMNDIINFQVDLKYKLNIMLTKYPERYLNFVRNIDQNKYKGINV